MADKYDSLKLENQLCFPLYACAKEVVKKYKPFLDELDITYTQYIAMMVMWEHRKMNVKELGEYLFLDSGTLTPLLKTLEKKGLVTRARSKEDERNLVVSVTDEGMALRDKALEVPRQVAGCIQLEEADAKELYVLLHKLMKCV
ncbi:MAG: MarR family transcriptional regulator [Lachnospiraceae bacterium]|nr:MarR family transcriptional regulator [Lachnospiraceae bacterium]